MTLLTSCHEEVDGACGAETRGLGEGLTSFKLDVSGKQTKQIKENKTENMMLPVTTRSSEQYAQYFAVIGEIN